MGDISCVDGCSLKTWQLRGMPVPSMLAVRAVAFFSLPLCFVLLIFGMIKWLSHERLGNSEIRPPH